LEEKHRIGQAGFALLVLTIAPGGIVLVPSRRWRYRMPRAVDARFCGAAQAREARTSLGGGLSRGAAPQHGTVRWTRWHVRQKLQKTEVTSSMALKFCANFLGSKKIFPILMIVIYDIISLLHCKDSVNLYSSKTCSRQVWAIVAAKHNKINSRWNLNISWQRWMAS